MKVRARSACGNVIKRFRNWAKDRGGATAVEVSLLLAILTPVAILVLDLARLEMEKRRLSQLSRAQASNVVANFGSAQFEPIQTELTLRAYDNPLSQPQTRVFPIAGSCSCDAYCHQAFEIQNRRDVQTLALGSRNVSVSLRVKREVYACD